MNKRGTLVENPDEIIQSIDVVGNNIVVTFYWWIYKNKTCRGGFEENIPQLYKYHILTSKIGLSMYTLVKKLI